MTRAKHAGGNLMKFYAAEMNARALERLDLETGLRHAIKQDELVLHYQPQVSLSTGAIIGAEALVRWQHPQRGLVPPVEFIPIAEQSDIIPALGEWVLRTACAQSHPWREAGLPPITVGVNLSARQLTSQDIVELTGRVLGETGLPGSALELTETILIAQPRSLGHRRRCRDPRAARLPLRARLRRDARLSLQSTDSRGRVRGTAARGPCARPAETRGDRALPRRGHACASRSGRSSGLSA